MKLRFLAAFTLALAFSASPAKADAGATKRLSTGASSLSFKDRCAIAGVLGKEMRDLLTWIDPRRLPGVMGDDGFALLIVRAAEDDGIRSVFAQGERCIVSLDRVHPSPGKIEVHVAEDPPKLLPPGRAYALLYMRDLGRGRWQFDWSLSSSGYTGCPDEPADRINVETCRHPAFLHGSPSAEVRIVVAKRGAGFEAEVANLEVPKWSAARSPSD